MAIPTDVTDESQVERLITETVKRYGRLDLLVNNAGIGGGGPIENTSTETFDLVLNTNLRGTFFCCRAGFRQMKQNGGGTIINMASVAGLQASEVSGQTSRMRAGFSRDPSK